MKTILKFTALSAVLIIASFSFVNAQENLLTNKKGTPILPTAGTWALGVDASPFLNYFGRLFSDQGATAPTFNGTTFFGKYFVQDNRALRFGATVDMGSTILVTTVDKIGSPGEFVENTYKFSLRNISLFFGTERRLGTNRLQGFYGLEGSFEFITANTTRTWGNPLSINNTNGGWWRTLTIKHSREFLIGARLFAGVDYFIAPGISLGGRVGYGVDFRITGKTSWKEESWQGGAVQRRTTEESNNNLRPFDFKNFGGGIALTFHLNK